MNGRLLPNRAYSLRDYYESTQWLQDNQDELQSKEAILILHRRDCARDYLIKVSELQPLNLQEAMNRRLSIDFPFAKEGFKATRDGRVYQMKFQQYEWQGEVIKLRPYFEDLGPREKRPAQDA